LGSASNTPGTDVLAGDAATAHDGAQFETVVGEVLDDPGVFPDAGRLEVRREYRPADRDDDLHATLR